MDGVTVLCGRKTKDENFSSKVGIEPLSTPFLGFQGSRGSRKIKKWPLIKYSMFFLYTLIS